MSITRTLLPFAPAALLAFALPAHAEEKAPAPLAADAVNGARLYRLHCDACHGVGTAGDGALAPGLNPKPPALRDGAYLFSHSDEQLLDVLSGQTLPKDAPPIHGRGLTQLEQRDILLWLKQPVPTVADFFPQASDYIAHKQAIDQYGQERAQKALGRALTTEEQAVMVLTVFKPAPPAEGEPPRARTGAQMAPEEPAALYELKPIRKIGFVTYLPLKLDQGTVQVALALDSAMRLKVAQTVATGDEKNEKLRKQVDPIVRSFVGSGGRAEKKPVEPQGKGVKAPKDVQREMLLAYTRLLEGAAMYEKEERDRFWADPDAFKFPAAADQPEDVKFEFKQKK